MRAAEAVLVPLDLPDEGLAEYLAGTVRALRDFPAKSALKNGVALCLAAPSAACQRTLVAARLGAFLRSEPDIARARRRVAEKAPAVVSAAAGPEA